MRVYDVIKTAEDTYISETSRFIYPGMCWCLKVSAVKGFDFKERDIHLIRIWLIISLSLIQSSLKLLRMAGLDFWWGNLDTESRLRAF